MTTETSVREHRVKEGIEFGATALMAVAAVLTAWAAFQATKWSGVQADSYSAAAAARTESAKATTLAATQRSIDAETFLSWLSAYSADLKSGAVDPAGAYDASRGDALRLHRGQVQAGVSARIRRMDRVTARG